MALLKLLLASGLTVVSLTCWGRTYNFDSSMIDSNGESVDVALFNQGLQLPGEYFASVIVNGNKVSSENISFRIEKHDGDEMLSPCLTSEQLTKYGIDVSKYSGLFEAGVEGCANLWAIPQADVRYDFNQQKLVLVLPQQALFPKLDGMAPMQLWDDGIPSALLNYQATMQNRKYKEGGANNESYYIQLQPGLNIGAWRLRSSASWQKEQGWQHSYAYMERGLNSIKSRLTLGESYSDSSVFDSIPFIGGKLTSDESMVPYTQWGFAPTIRGVARTQARVEIQQNGYTVSNDLVPSGPFELTSPPVGGGGGDLKVIIHESDGTQQIFYVPYDAPAVALRQGYFQYSVMGGKYRPVDDAIRTTSVGAVEMKYGLPWDLTLYGGFQGANNYQAAALGIGSLLGDLGAVSADITQSNSRKNNQQKEHGQRWRVRYNKSWDTGTSFNIASEEYATEGFNTLSDTLDTYFESESKDYCDAASPKKTKNKVSLNISQTIGEAGILNFSGYRENYWSDKSTTTSFSAGYGKTFSNGISVNVSLSKAEHIYKNGEKKSDQLTNLWLSFPIGSWLNKNSINANYQMTSDSQGSTTHEFGVYGDVLDRQLRWDVRERYRESTDNKISSALSLNYRGTYGDLRGNYSYDKNQRQLDVGLNGNVIVTQYGVTAGQNMGDTIALVQARGVNGASVGYFPGVKTDFRGYASYGNLTPYQENNISIDPVTLPENAEISQTSTRVIPTKGAVVLAKFDTRIGGRLLLQLKRSDNKPIPFGSIASIEGDALNTSVVGDNDQVYLTGVGQKAKVKVQWGKEDKQSCYSNIVLPKESGSSGIYKLSAVCKL
ncbi:fimbrial biogenesis outer membrane usher protein [Salmonella enterica]|nr:fimbrial biogenesis outer membrane usher protein [Salmonella enterica]EBO9238578.1 fimbrial biogenesis outer membrane usher protein [Salmonella enterica]EBP2882707.1 fimbrial biogenesis outer membrane usher protein [Salmonella enterica]EBR0769899.1 fimbrial biogenesis outer membrane usher protein [Salmonella enterica]